MNPVEFLCLSPPPVLSFILPPPPWKILRHFGKLTVVLWGVRMKRKRAGGGREWKRGRDKDMHCKSTEIRLWYKHNLHGSCLIKIFWDEKIKSFNSCIVFYVTFSSCLSLIVHSPWFHVWRRTTGELIVSLNLTSLLICCKVRERGHNNCGDMQV